MSSKYMTILKIENLDRAAFLSVIGAELIEVTGSYPRFVYYFKVTDAQQLKERRDKRVVYFEYMKKRKWLKRGGGLINIPTDDNETLRLHQASIGGYLLKDVAKITYLEGGDKR